MAITRTQIARQLQNRGGITNMSVRQNYGLGSIVKKAVKGVTKAAKNVVSSDLGKAALLAGGAYYLGGGNLFGLQRAGLSTPGFSLSNLPGAGFFTGGAGAAEGSFRAAQEAGLKKGLFSKFPGGGTGLAGAIGLTGFLASQGMEEEQIEAIKQDPEALKVYLRRYYTNLNPPTADTDADTYNKEVEDFVTSQTAEYSTSFAKGGRVNRRLGSPEEGEGIMMIEQREEIAGGPYTTGNDVKDAFGVWNNSDQGVKELYEGFIDFFKSGDWRDQIQGSKIKTKTKRMASAPDPLAELNNLSISVFNKPYNSLNEMEMEQLTEFMSNKKAEGGRIGFDMGGTYDDFKEFMMRRKESMSERQKEELKRQFDMFMRSKDPTVEAAEGGPINNIDRMDFKVGEGVASLPIRQNKAGVKELDLRSTGGFIPPIGTKEKADDVPAMLSNNEFVFTADAVRAAGGGNVEKGAQRMYDTMKKLESRVG
jgi:hypothetical protein